MTFEYALRPRSASFVTVSATGCSFSSRLTEAFGVAFGELSDTRRNCLTVDAPLPKLVLGAKGCFCPEGLRFAGLAAPQGDDLRFAVALRIVDGGGGEGVLC